MRQTNMKVFSFAKSALLAAAAFAFAGTSLHADEIAKATGKSETVYTYIGAVTASPVDVLEFKDGKELDGEERLRLPRNFILRFVGDKAEVKREIEPANNGRRGHGDGTIDVAKADAVLTLLSVHGNNEPGVYRRTHKVGPGTLVIGGTTDNDGAKLVVWDGTLVLGKASDGGTHAQGSNGFLEVYSSRSADVANGSPDRVGILSLGGTGGDQIADEATVIVGGPHSDRGGVFDLNSRTETVGGLSLTNGTLRFAFGGAAGKTGTLTVESETPVKATGKNFIEITEASKWLPGEYVLVKTSEGFSDGSFESFTLKGADNGKLALSADKKTITLTIAK